MPEEVPMPVIGLTPARTGEWPWQHWNRTLPPACALPQACLPLVLRDPATHAAVATFLLQQTRAQRYALACAQDIPLHTLA